MSQLGLGNRGADWIASGGINRCRSLASRANECSRISKYLAVGCASLLASNVGSSNNRHDGSAFCVRRWHVRIATTVSSPMSYLRKIAVILLIIAVAPAMVLAAMPVKYCIAGVGQHQALEFVIDGVSHDGEHSSHHYGAEVRAAHFDDCGLTALIEHEACTDTALTIAAKSHSPVPNFVALPEVSTASGPPSEAAAPVSSHAGVRLVAELRSDPRMTSHHLTVLRI